MVNLLLNPGFETGTVGNPDNWWTYTGDGTLLFTYPEPGRLGGSSVTISSPNTLNEGSWGQTVAVDSAKTYTLSGYMKTQNIVGGVVIGIDWDNISENWIGYTELASIEGTVAWTYYTGNITPPAGAAYGNIILEFWYITGKAWIDDMSFSEVDVPVVCNVPACNFVMT